MASVTRQPYLASLSLAVDHPTEAAPLRGAEVGRAPLGFAVRQRLMDLGDPIWLFRFSLYPAEAF